MRTTLDIDDDALREAQRYAPELTKTALIAAALKAFARQEARKAILEGALYTPEFGGGGQGPPGAPPHEEPPRRKST